MPAFTTVMELPDVIGLLNSRIQISKSKENNIYYARINGFVSEEATNCFAYQ
jgi:hypothetical protein